MSQNGSNLFSVPHYFGHNSTKKKTSDDMNLLPGNDIFGAVAIGLASLSRKHGGQGFDLITNNFKISKKNLKDQALHFQALSDAIYSALDNESKTWQPPNRSSIFKKIAEEINALPLISIGLEDLQTKLQATIPQTTPINLKDCLDNFLKNDETFKTLRKKIEEIDKSCETQLEDAALITPLAKALGMTFIILSHDTFKPTLHNYSPQNPNNPILNLLHIDGLYFYLSGPTVDAKETMDEVYKNALNIHSSTPIIALDSIGKTEAITEVQNNIDTFSIEHLVRSIRLHQYKTTQLNQFQLELQPVSYSGSDCLYRALSMVLFDTEIHSRSIKNLSRCHTNPASHKEIYKCAVQLGIKITVFNAMNPIKDQQIQHYGNDTFDAWWDYSPPSKTNDLRFLELNSPYSLSLLYIDNHFHALVPKTGHAVPNGDITAINTLVGDNLQLKSRNLPAIDLTDCICTVMRYLKQDMIPMAVEWGRPNASFSNSHAGGDCFLLPIHNSGSDSQQPDFDNPLPMNQLQDVRGHDCFTYILLDSGYAQALPNIMDALCIPTDLTYNNQYRYYRILPERRIVGSIITHFDQDHYGGIFELFKSRKKNSKLGRDHWDHELLRHILFIVGSNISKGPRDELSQLVSNFPKPITTWKISNTISVHVPCPFDNASLESYRFEPSSSSIKADLYPTPFPQKKASKPRNSNPKCDDSKCDDSKDDSKCDDSKDDSKCDDSITNTNSIVTHFQENDTHYLFTGDSIIQRLETVINGIDGSEGTSTQFDAFQLPHHGSIRNSLRFIGSCVDFNKGLDVFYTLLQTRAKSYFVTCPGTLNHLNKDLWDQFEQLSSRLGYAISLQMGYPRIKSPIFQPGLDSNLVTRYWFQNDQLTLNDRRYCQIPTTIKDIKFHDKTSFFNHQFEGYGENDADTNTHHDNGSFVSPQPRNLPLVQQYRKLYQFFTTTLPALASSKGTSTTHDIPFPPNNLPNSFKHLVHVDQPIYTKMGTNGLLEMLQFSVSPSIVTNTSTESSMNYESGAMEDNPDTSNGAAMTIGSHTTTTAMNDDSTMDDHPTTPSNSSAIPTTTTPSPPPTINITFMSIQFFYDGSDCIGMVIYPNTALLHGPYHTDLVQNMSYISDNDLIVISNMDYNPQVFSRSNDLSHQLLQSPPAPALSPFASVLGGTTTPGSKLPLPTTSAIPITITNLKIPDGSTTPTIQLLHTESSILIKSIGDEPSLFSLQTCQDWMSHLDFPLTAGEIRSTHEQQSIFNGLDQIIATIPSKIPQLKFFRFSTRSIHTASFNIERINHTEESNEANGDYNILSARIIIIHKDLSIPLIGKPTPSRPHHTITLDVTYNSTTHTYDHNIAITSPLFDCYYSGPTPTITDDHNQHHQNVNNTIEPYSTNIDHTRDGAQPMTFTFLPSSSSNRRPRLAITPNALILKDLFSNLLMEPILKSMKFHVDNLSEYHAIDLSFTNVVYCEFSSSQHLDSAAPFESYNFDQLTIDLSLDQLYIVDHYPITLTSAKLEQFSHSHRTITLQGQTEQSPNATYSLATFSSLDKENDKSLKFKLLPHANNIMALVSTLSPSTPSSSHKTSSTIPIIDLAVTATPRMSQRLITFNDALIESYSSPPSKKNEITPLQSQLNDFGFYLDQIHVNETRKDKGEERNVLNSNSNLVIIQENVSHHSFYFKLKHNKWQQVKSTLEVIKNTIKTHQLEVLLKDCLKNPATIVVLASSSHPTAKSNAEYTATVPSNTLQQQYLKTYWPTTHTFNTSQPSLNYHHLTTQLNKIAHQPRYDLVPWVTQNDLNQVNKVLGKGLKQLPLIHRLGYFVLDYNPNTSHSSKIWSNKLYVDSIEQMLLNPANTAFVTAWVDGVFHPVTFDPVTSRSTAPILSLRASSQHVVIILKPFPISKTTFDYFSNNIHLRNRYNNLPMRLMFECDSQASLSKDFGDTSLSENCVPHVNQNTSGLQIYTGLSNHLFQRQSIFLLSSFKPLSTDANGSDVISSQEELRNNSKKHQGMSKHHHIRTISRGRLDTRLQKHLLASDDFFNKALRKTPLQIVSFTAFQDGKNLSLWKKTWKKNHRSNRMTTASHQTHSPVSRSTSHGTNTDGTNVISSREKLNNNKSKRLGSSDKIVNNKALATKSPPPTAFQNKRNSLSTNGNHRHVVRNKKSFPGRSSSSAGNRRSITQAKLPPSKQ